MAEGAHRVGVGVGGGVGGGVGSAGVTVARDVRISIEKDNINLKQLKK